MKIKITNTARTTIQILNSPQLSLGQGESLNIDTMTASPEERLLCGAIVQPRNSTLIVSLIPEGKISFEIDSVIQTQEQASVFFTNSYAKYHKAQGISYLAKDSSGEINFFFDLDKNKLVLRDPISGKLYTFTPDN